VYSWLVNKLLHLVCLFTCPIWSRSSTRCC